MNVPKACGRAAGGAPWGLVGMAALMLLVESAVERRGLDLLDVDDWAYRKALKSARLAKNFDVLCFGDSLVKLGVVPRGVEERSGLKTCNLAVSGSQASSSHALLKRCLDAGARPSAVVVDFQPPLLRLNPRHNLHRWANVLSVSESAALACSARDPDLFATIMLEKAWPSCQRREAVRANVMGALKGTGDNHRYYNFLAFRNWSRNGGAQLNAATPSLRTMSEKDAAAIRLGFYPKWEGHPANLAGLEQFLALSAEHHVPVYWVLPPLLPALQRQMAESGIDAAHDAFVRSWQARFSNLVVVDGRGKMSDPAAFYDANHLAAGGSYAYSQALGDLLRQRRSGVLGDRWATLPTIRPVALPDGFEDLDQSRVALGAIEKASRH